MYRPEKICSAFNYTVKKLESHWAFYLIKLTQFLIVGKVQEHFWHAKVIGIRYKREKSAAGDIFSLITKAECWKFYIAGWKIDMIPSLAKCCSNGIFSYGTIKGHCTKRPWRRLLYHNLAGWKSKWEIKIARPAKVSFWYWPQERCHPKPERSCPLKGQRIMCLEFMLIFFCKDSWAIHTPFSPKEDIRQNLIDSSSLSNNPDRIIFLEDSCYILWPDPRRKVFIVDMTVHGKITIYLYLSKLFSHRQMNVASF